MINFKSRSFIFSIIILCILILVIYFKNNTLNKLPPKQVISERVPKKRPKEEYENNFGITPEEAKELLMKFNETLEETSRFEIIKEELIRDGKFYNKDMIYLDTGICYNIESSIESGKIIRVSMIGKGKKKADNLYTGLTGLIIMTNINFSNDVDINKLSINLFSRVDDYINYMNGDKTKEWREIVNNRGARYIKDRKYIISFSNISGMTVIASLR